MLEPTSPEQYCTPNTHGCSAEVSSLRTTKRCPRPLSSNVLHPDVIIRQNEHSGTTKLLDGEMEE